MSDGDVPATGRCRPRSGLRGEYFKIFPVTVEVDGSPALTRLLSAGVANLSVAHVHSDRQSCHLR
jgi:hypothetical protein